ncbi:MAG: type II toxin-antitoxin system VapC family toxin [Candidatus Hodarchaeales archaeon]
MISSMDKKTVHVFLDTNFLMALGQMFGLNMTHEIDRVIPAKRKLIILTPITRELVKLKGSSSLKVQKEAEIALQFIKKYCQEWEVEYQHKNVDFILLHYSREYNGFLATNDKRLKKLARKNGVRTLYIRNQKYLEIQ